MSVCHHEAVIIVASMQLAPADQVALRDFSHRISTFFHIAFPSSKVA